LARLVLSLDRPAALPARSQIEVIWAGHAAVVEAVRLVEASASPWSIAIYLDAPTVRPEALARVVERLVRAAPDLVELGEVSIVLADPAPRRFSGPTLDGEELIAALERLERESRATGELPWLRQRFAARGKASDALLADDALRQEEALVLELQEGRSEWLETSRIGAPAARAVLLLSDGFDLEPEAHYSLAAGESLQTGRRLRRAFEEHVRRAAGSGWRLLPVTLGDRSVDFLEPLEPLAALARATGGRVLTSPRALSREIAFLARRIEVDVEIPAFAVAEAVGPQALEIRWPSGADVRGPSWLALGDGPEPLAALRESSRGSMRQSAGGKAIRLVPPPAVPADEVRVAVLATRPDVARVELWLDGSPVTTAGRPPLEVRLGVDLASGAVKLEARALGESGELLGGDSLILAAGTTDAPRVEIARLGGSGGGAPGLEIAAAVQLPDGRRVERVDFFWNEEPVASFEQEPYRVVLDAPLPQPGDFARVVAHLEDGSVLEAARFAREEGLAGSLAVNLVEVYALVRARHEPPAGLERGDFSVFQGEREQAIEEFARAADLPLELGLAIDTSSSMKGWMAMARAAAASFLDAVLRPGDEGFLVDFDQWPRLAHAKTRDHESLIRRFGSLHASGATALYDSILYALLQFDAPRARRALVVLSDGKDEGSLFGPEECVARARQAGVPIYIISLGDPADQQRSPRRLVNNRLAAATGGAVYNVSSPDRLAEIYRRIAVDLESHYLLTFSTDRALSGREMREIRVRVRDPSLTVRTLVSEGAGS
jgi:Ca-activated chloride channel family protein